MTPLTIKCKIVGVYQDETGFYARIRFYRSEIVERLAGISITLLDNKSDPINCQITREQFHTLKLGDAKLTLEVE